MYKVHNFSAGPSILPASVLKQASTAVLNWMDSGLSVLEVSHRSPDFQVVMSRTEELVRNLLGVPDSHCVLFLQGGASTQFSMVPLNFLQYRQKASYLDTGYFSQKAIKEARLFGAVEIVDSARNKKYNYIPEKYEVSFGSAYLHLTSNNTIEGTQIIEFPKPGVPLICDMSSDIFSRVINVADFDLIYAGAQKNLGPAGMTLVIARNSFLDGVKHKVPAMSDYRVHRESGSMFNTPPMFSIYVSMLNLMHLKANGGVEGAEKINLEKSRILYAEIDRNSLFRGLANPKYRSAMNVTFVAKDLETETNFLKLASKKGIVGITGYPTIGGFRVSLYNALPLASVAALVALMKEFEKVTLRAVPLIPIS